MEIRLLGPVEVRVHAAIVPLRRGRQSALVAALALGGEQGVRADALVELLWPRQRPVHPANALQHLVAQVRGALGDERSRLVTARRGYVLHVAPTELDARRFEDAIAAARRLQEAGDLATARQEVEQALSWWRGEALHGLEGRRFEEEARRLTDLQAQGELLVADLALASGDLIGVEERLARATALRPLNEALWQRRIEVLARSGRTAEALVAYDGLRTLLAEELGVDPSPGIRQLHARVLQEDSTMVTGRGMPLPPVLSSFVGRRHEFAELNDHLAGAARIVTLVGPAGVGKSRLALEVARTQSRPVVLVPLDGIEPTGDVIGAVAAGLGVREQWRREVVDVVAEALPADGVLLLDTVEHVASATASVVLSILARRDDVAVLATGHAPLGIAGEVVLRLAPLAVPPSASSADVLASPAVQLLADRADLRLRDPADPAVHRAAAAIVRAVDGVPLAIELAASRVPLLPLGSLAESLSRSTSLLDGDDEGRPQRHRGLSRAASWSVALLPHALHDVFEALGTFAGSFDVDAVVAVTGRPHAEALAALVTLANRSLLLPADPIDGTPRWRLLASLRAEATERLAAAGRSYEDRHLEWIVGLVEEADLGLRGADQQAWVARLDAARGDIERALAYALAGDDHVAAARIVAALGRYWDWRGRLHDMRRWTMALQQAVAAGHDAPRLGAVLAWLAYAQVEGGQGDEARKTAREAEAAARHVGDPDGTITALSVLAIAARNDGDLDGAVRRAGHVMAASAAFDQSWGQAWGRVARGHARAALGDLRGALVDARASVREFAALGDVRAQQWGEALRALVALRRGRPGLARPLGERALRVAESLQDLRTAALLYEILGECSEDVVTGRTLWTTADSLRAARGQVRPGLPDLVTTGTVKLRAR